MASGDTKTNQYLDIAANGTRADLPTDTCCETRSQTLIREVAERIIDVEEEVEQLENNPDVVDIVATYQDLQDYDTSGLTDKDIIRVLEDSTHDDNSTYYRWNAATSQFDYVGEISGGSSYTAGDGIDITNDVISATNTGKARELTSADYNYPTSSPNTIALWLLPAGQYYTKSGVSIRYATNGGGGTTGKGIIITDNTGVYTSMLVIDSNDATTTEVVAQTSNGALVSSKNVLTGSVVQSTGASTTDVMSQDAVTKMVYPRGLVSSSPAIVLGNIAETSATDQTISIGWTNTANRQYNMSFGYYAQATGNRSIAIGNHTIASANGSIALGSGSSATTAGEINIGSSNTSYGYNSSNYRLLTGLYDPQSAHDAATKGYVDTQVGNIDTALQTLLNGTGA